MRVLVLGAGIIGVSIADALARRGAEVTVLDARSPGRGASFASAGMLAPYAEAHGDPRLLGLLTRSLDLFDPYVAQLAADTGLPIEYARSGTLEVAFDAAHQGELERRKTVLDRAGVAAELMDAATVRRFEPAVSDAVVQGLFTPLHGLVGVQALVAALTHRARFAGAVFEFPIEATGVQSLRDRVRVDTAAGPYEAEVAVLAAGSWSRQIRVRHVAALPVRPIRGQLLHLRWRGADRPRRIVWGAECYTVPWADSTLLVGATVEDVGFDESTTVQGVQALTAAAGQLLRSAGAASVDSIRMGLRPATPDGLPAIGPLSRAPRVVVATGHYRNGVLLAPLTAELVSRQVLDGVADDALSMISPDRLLA